MVGWGGGWGGGGGGGVGRGEGGIPTSRVDDKIYFENTYLETRIWDGAGPKRSRILLNPIPRVARAGFGLVSRPRGLS